MGSCSAGRGTRSRLLIQPQTVHQCSFQLQERWVLHWVWAGASARSSGGAGLSKARLDPPAGPAAPARQECRIQGLSRLNPFTHSSLRGMFLFIQLTRLHLLLCYFTSEALAKQFFPAAGAGRVQPSTRHCWDSPAPWNEPLQRSLLPFSPAPGAQRHL